ncbi:MAG TPA: DUF3108 domain-containing protein [Cyclobacteriaceae bacterium]|nr:DUF3108 domain-containing protein [Cyclobacteriaceae bacterium]
MKRLILFLSAALIVTLGSGFVAMRQTSVPYMVDRPTSFGKGEELEYKVNFGFLHVGKAITRIDNRVHKVNSRPCYKIDAFGETSDWMSWVADVEDNWGAYIDTTTMSTQVSYRKIKENSYRLEELSNFDHETHKVVVKVKNKESGVYEEKNRYDIPQNAKDLVGGFMLLRQIDFAKLHKGDTVTISGFFEDTSYYLKVMYLGKETIKTSVGKIPCNIMKPIMPDNKLFDGENSITCWISDDGNKIPVKIQAKMFIGHTGLELVSFRGLRNQIKIVP